MCINTLIALHTLFSIISKMSELANNFTELQYFFYSRADIRVRDKPFMGSPFAFIGSYLCLLVLLTIILPKILSDKKPLNFRKMYDYIDWILIIISVYFTCWGVFGWFFVYSFLCQPIDKSQSFYGIQAVELCWQFLISKFVYTLENFAFLLAKKENTTKQYLISHHIVFPIMLWFGINFYPGGHVSKLFNFML